MQSLVWFLLASKGTKKKVMFIYKMTLITTIFRCGWSWSIMHGAWCIMQMMIMMIIMITSWWWLIMHALCWKWCCPKTKVLLFSDFYSTSPELAPQWFTKLSWLTLGSNSREVLKSAMAWLQPWGFKKDWGDYAYPNRTRCSIKGVGIVGYLDLVWSCKFCIQDQGGWFLYTKSCSSSMV